MAFTKKKCQDLIKQFLIMPNDTKTVDTINEAIKEYGYLPKTAIVIGKLAQEKKLNDGLFTALLTAKFPRGYPKGERYYRPKKALKKIPDSNSL